MSFGSEQVDGEIALAGVGQQLLGSGDVLLALRQLVADVGGVERRVEVVGDSPVPGEDLLDHRVAVDDQRIA